MASSHRFRGGRSGSSSSSSTDFYKLLQVHPTATLSEIKVSYYRIALQLHPDKHKGCRDKRERFQLVNEAYTVLSDLSQRRAYDREQGHWMHNTNYNTNSNNTNTKNSNSHNQSAPPRKDYRKVHMPRPPPHWKTTWDHVKHYEMHYGTGMQQEAIRQALKTAEREGAFDYHSPLGKGFTFDHIDNDSKNNKNTTNQQQQQSSGTTCNDNSNTYQYNPYSKRTPQGPPKVVFEYEEGHNLSGTEFVARRERIVHDMHSRRRDREQQQAPRRAAAAWPYAQYQPHFGGNDDERRPFGNTTKNEATTTATNNNNNSKDSCVIL